MRISSAHAGVSFAFPPAGGSITYRVARADGGASYGWTFERAGVDIPFAGSATPDLAVEPRLQPTDASGWSRSGGAYRVTYPGGFKPVVHPIRVVARPDGLVGLVFDAAEFWGDDDVPQHDRIAVLNFPAGQHAEFTAIAFYFLDETWIEDIALVIGSVIFAPSSASLPDSEIEESPAPGPPILPTLVPRPR